MILRQLSGFGYIVESWKKFTDFRRVTVNVDQYRWSSLSLLHLYVIHGVQDTVVFSILFSRSFRSNACLPCLPVMLD